MEDEDTRAGAWASMLAAAGTYTPAPISPKARKQKAAEDNDAILARRPTPFNGTVSAFDSRQLERRPEFKITTRQRLRAAG